MSLELKNIRDSDSKMVCILDSGKQVLIDPTVIYDIRIYR